MTSLLVIAPGTFSRIMVGSLGDWVMTDPFWYGFDVFWDDEYPLAGHIGPGINWDTFAQSPVNEDNVKQFALETY